MSDIKELEQYFDILLKEEEDLAVEHFLMTDEKRFELYVAVRKHFMDISTGLDKISNSMGDKHVDYVLVVKQISHSFSELANLGDEDLDYCIRAMAVDRLIYKAQNAGTRASEMLGYLLEGMVAFFFGDGDEIIKITKEAVASLKEEKNSRFFKRKEDEGLKQDAMEVLELYEEIEANLKDAKQGIIAKDKNMLKVLKQLKIGMGKQLVNLAVQKSTKPKPKVKRRKTKPIGKFSERER